MHGAAESRRGPATDWQAPPPAGPVHARLRPPRSEAGTHRPPGPPPLAGGPAVIPNPLRARDTLLMAAAMRALGARIEDASADACVERAGDGGAGEAGAGTAWRVTPGQVSGAAVVDVGNAGTVLRFVPP